LNELCESIEHTLSYLKARRDGVKDSLKKQKLTRAINTLEESLAEIKAAHDL
jgi:hypothetical protein